jgi:hypothetical protein
MRGGGGEGSGGQSAAAPVCLSNKIDLNASTARAGASIARGESALAATIRECGAKRRNARVDTHAEFG